VVPRFTSHLNDAILEALSRRGSYVMFCAQAPHPLGGFKSDDEGSVSSCGSQPRRTIDRRDARRPSWPRGFAGRIEGGNPRPGAAGRRVSSSKPALPNTLHRRAVWVVGDLVDGLE
jgi:hypothetical protein